MGSGAIGTRDVVLRWRHGRGWFLRPLPRRNHCVEIRLALCIPGARRTESVERTDHLAVYAGRDQEARATCERILVRGRSALPQSFLASHLCGRVLRVLFADLDVHLYQFLSVAASVFAADLDTRFPVLRLSDQRGGHADRGAVYRQIWLQAGAAVRHGGGSLRRAADAGSERCRDHYRARAGLRRGVCGADMCEWIYRPGYENQPRAGGGIVRHGVQHRRKHRLGGPRSRVEIVRMAGSGDLDRYGAGVDDAARVAAMAGASTGTRHMIYCININR